LSVPVQLTAQSTARKYWSQNVFLCIKQHVKCCRNKWTVVFYTH